MSWLADLFRPRVGTRPPRPGRNPDGIVLCVDPAFFAGATSKAFSGQLARLGEVRRVPYGPFGIPIPTNTAVDEGVENVQNALGAAMDQASGVVTLACWSEGAGGVATKWLDEHGRSEPFDPARLQILLFGNPERKYGGVLMVPHPPRKIVPVKFAYGSPAHPEPGIPEDTPYQVVDFAVRHDGWADCPMAENPSAVALSTPDDGIHCDYGLLPFSPVRLDHPGIKVRREGNIQYVLHPGGHRVSAEVEAEFRRPDGLQECNLPKPIEWLRAP